MDLVHDRGSMDPVHERGPWTWSKEGVHGPLVLVLSSPSVIRHCREKLSKREVTVMIVAVFLKVRLYFYQEKISLTQKVLAWERKVQILKKSTSFEN